MAIVEGMKAENLHDESFAICRCIRRNFHLRFLCSNEHIQRFSFDMLQDLKLGFFM